MRLCFNIDLPDTDLRVGTWGPMRDAELRRYLVDQGGPLDMSQRSLLGAEGRQYRRFFPVIQCLETLTQIDEWQLARFELAGFPLPPLYLSGVRYQEEPPGEEEWLDTPTLYRLKRGDCEDVGCARAAELRFLHHIPAVPCIKFREYSTPKGRLTLIHVLTLHPDGTIEDPSALLGMKGEYS